MSKHTPGVARVAFGTLVTVSPIGCVEGSKVIAECQNQSNPEMAMHNARRVAALWNLMAEFETDEFEGKELHEFIKQRTRLNHMNAAGGGASFQFEGGACGMLVEAFAAQFKQSGATNYLELGFEHPDTGPVTVTMQRKEGVSPAQKLDVVTKQRDELVAAYKNLLYMQGTNPMHGGEDTDLRDAKIRMAAALKAANGGEA